MASIRVVALSTFCRIAVSALRFSGVVKVRTSWIRAIASFKRSGAASVSSCTTDGLEVMTGSPEGGIATKAPEAGLPPSRATKDTPVTPCDDSVATVSLRTGVAALISILTRTSAGFCASSAMSRTFPTSTPL